MGKRRGRRNKGKANKWKPLLIPFESIFLQDAISADNAENLQENDVN